MIRLNPLLIAAAIVTSPVVAEPPEQLFAIHCAACHAADYALVGPSLVEIAGIYKEDPEGFVNWSLRPGKKRPEMIEMPSMAHLGKDTLREIHRYILSAAQGKTEKKSPTAADGDPFPDVGARPKVQRMFMPDASPAAIAVALPGELSYVFDAGECRLRYVWKGGFIDGWPYWKGNGSELAKVDGEIVYREQSPLFRVVESGESSSKFLGYSLSDGIPTFRYRLDGVRFSERILPLPTGDGVLREIETDGTMAIRLGEVSGAEIVTESNENPLPAAMARKFTVTIRWK